MKSFLIAFFQIKVYSVLTSFVLVLIGIYRSFGSLWLSGSCRFEPSCSVYAEEAVQRFGFCVGGQMAISRLCRCRPGGPFGYDPVPKQSKNEVKSDSGMWFSPKPKKECS